MDDSGLAAHFRNDALRQLRKYKKMADAALAQVGDGDYFRTPDPESNSVALIVKHLAGNMRSRWRAFRESDGEKPDRNRDSEFEQESADTRQSLQERWEVGWALLFAALDSVGSTDADLLETVRIRGEEHSVLEAIQRQLTHYAYHVGQIVFLAKHFAGNRWKSLSIPKGKPREVDVAKGGSPYAIR